MFSNAALWGIYGYQRWISPRKGYRCAYAVRHGGPGCSGYAKHVIRDHGVFHALPLIRQRFADCKAAAVAFSQERGETEEERKRRRRENRREACCGGTELALLMPGACSISAARSAAQSKTKFCDTNPCDGDIGCGPCDVDVCSCGS